jgi:hypothetical protein
MADRLKLIDIKTTQDGYSNSVVMTFLFKIKGYSRDIRFLEIEANRKIKEMICFDFYDLSSCGWADPNCKTIQKSVLFNISKEVIYND